MTGWIIFLNIIIWTIVFYWLSKRNYQKKKVEQKHTAKNQTKSNNKKKK